MTSSESSSDEEIIGTDNFLSDHKPDHVALYVILGQYFGMILRNFSLYRLLYSSTSTMRHLEVDE